MVFIRVGFDRLEVAKNPSLKETTQMNSPLLARTYSASPRELLTARHQACFLSGA
jgi:hypothetical protein